MGFFGHLVASRAAPVPAFDAEPEPGDRVSGTHVWRVSEPLYAWDQVHAFSARLASGLPGGFLAASVFDSDGALLHVGIPGRDVTWSWLHLDGLVSNLVLPWAPFDEDGRPLSADEVVAQDAEWQQAADAYVEGLRSFGLEGSAAAEACRAWAQVTGLDPAPVDDVRAALEARNVFVEETFDSLLGTLGVARHSGMPGPTTSSP